MLEMYQDRIRSPQLRSKVTTAEAAAEWVHGGMSGFTRAGDVKVVPLALAERARHEQLKITLMTGASLGHDVDKALTEAGALARRMPFQADPVLRAAINRGEVMYIDQHLSELVEMLRTRQIAPIDVAIIEAIAITETGAIIPSTSVGNSASFAILAEKVIVEINLTQSLEPEGLHDIFIPKHRRRANAPRSSSISAWRSPTGNSSTGASCVRRGAWLVRLLTGTWAPSRAAGN